jgi:hypothetical protein
MNKLRGMTFEESFAYTLKDNKNAVVTIGIYKNGESSYEVYNFQHRGYVELPENAD